MTAKQFYDWQTAGGTNDVMRLVDGLERTDVDLTRNVLTFNVIRYILAP